MTRIAIFICALTGCATADDIHVHRGESPAAAIRMVTNGGTVVLHEGCLSEPLDIRKSLTLRSAENEHPVAAKIGVRATTDVTLSGLQILGDQSVALTILDASNVTIRDCKIQTDNGVTGVRIFDSSKTDISGSHVTGSKTAIIYQNSSDCSVVNCEIGPNGEDGIVIANGSRGITVKECQIHHHLGEGYPKAHSDGIQTFVRGDYELVRDITILNNLIYASSQCFHFQDTEGMTIRGNTMYGFSANAITLGYGTVKNVVIEDNTVAFAGLSLFNFTTCTEIQLRNNVLVSGNDAPIYSAKDVGLVAENNVLWNSDRSRQPTLLVKGIGYRTLEPFRRQTNLETGSSHRSPDFLNAPVAIAGADPARFDDLTEKWLPLFKYSTLFRVGDFVEVNFDGVVRKCTAIRRDGIEIDPPLSKKPDLPPIVVTWGDRDDFKVNLSLE